MVLNFIKSGYEKVKEALSKTSSFLGGRLKTLFGKGLDEDTLEEIERVLYEADLGVQTVQELVSSLGDCYKRNPDAKEEDYFNLIRKKLISIFQNDNSSLKEAESGPTVLLVVGVNGSGKTTLIAKLAQHLKNQGKNILIGAGDTFRAAAVDQLSHWAERIGCDIVKASPFSDPAAVAFDSIDAAISRKKDLVFIDTAGRLQNKTHLMQELEKIEKTIRKKIPEAPHETLLVIDANTGQNGVEQAKLFLKYVKVTGLVLTKLDGSSKGGVVVSIRRTLNIPVKFIGVGEGVDDLKPFESEVFIDSLLAK